VTMMAFLLGFLCGMAFTVVVSGIVGYYLTE